MGGYSAASFDAQGRQLAGGSDGTTRPRRYTIFLQPYVHITCNVYMCIRYNAIDSGSDSGRSSINLNPNPDPRPRTFTMSNSADARPSRRQGQGKRYPQEQGQGQRQGQGQGHRMGTLNEASYASNASLTTGASSNADWLMGDSRVDGNDVSYLELPPEAQAGFRGFMGDGGATEGARISVVAADNDSSLPADQRTKHNLLAMRHFQTMVGGAKLPRRPRANPDLRHVPPTILDRNSGVNAGGGSTGRVGTALGIYTERHLTAYPNQHHDDLPGGVENGRVGVSGVGGGLDWANEPIMPGASLSAQRASTAPTGAMGETQKRRYIYLYLLLLLSNSPE